MVKRLSMPTSMNKLESYQRLCMQSNRSSFPIFTKKQRYKNFVHIFIFTNFTTVHMLYSHASLRIGKTLFIGFSNTIKDMYQYFGFHLITKSILHHMLE